MNVPNEIIRGLITNVQRFSIHDGPGIRTTVFLKGCPLRCFWCHNPETLRPQLEIEFFPDRCIGCGECIRRCPEGAQTVEDGRRVYRRELCQLCGRCVETCYAEALMMAGRWWTAEELLEELLRDRPFYDQSAGGVTLSGGEPLLQPYFSARVLQLCKEAGLHTAIETAALGQWERLADLLRWTDLVMVDIKIIDDMAHRAATGVSNRPILANVQRMAEQAAALIVRTPVVPTVNDTAEAIGAIAAFVAGLPGVQYYELMPFHKLAAGKYRSLGLEYRAADLASADRELLTSLGEVARRAGVRDVRVA
jgi:pyruvate formate lyase activating enzyme